MSSTAFNNQIRNVVSAIIGGVSALSLGGFAAPVLAQTQTPEQQKAADQEIQEIVVTGIKASLQKSLDIKQNTIGVVDAISAEDIGQFPDASLGEAIARIPGVTVNRGNINQAAAAGAPSSTGQVTGITVRGFGSQFNEILQEGRYVASGNGQNFDVGVLGAQYVGEIAVFKTPDFALSTGAVGATINIKNPNPLDHPGLLVQAFGSANNYQNDGGTTPSYGAFFSDTFLDNTVGFLVAFDETNKHITGDHLSDVGWKGTYLACTAFAPGDFPTGSGCTSSSPSTQKSLAPSWYQQDQAMYLERTDSRRRDGRVAIQWRPNDAVLVTIDDNYSSDSENTNRWQYSTWFGSFANVQQDANGTITNFTYANAPTDFNAFNAQTYITTNTPGLNVKWDLNDHWTETFDVAQSLSRLNPNGSFSDIDADIGYGPNTSVGTNGYTGGLVVSGNGNNIPYWTAVGPGAVAPPGSTTPVISPNYLGLNPYILGSHVLPIQIQQNNDRITQAKLDWAYHDEHTKVNFGVQYVDDRWNSQEYDTFTNNEWQLWSGYGVGSNNYEYYCQTPYSSATQYGTATSAGGKCNQNYTQTNVANARGVPVIAVPHGVPLPSSLFNVVQVPNFIPGLNGNGNLPPALLQFSPYAVLNYLETQPINADYAPSAGYGPYTGGVPQAALSTGSVANIDRKNFGPFVTAEHDFAIGSMTLKPVLGLRYEYTESVISGLAAPLTALVPEPGDASAYSFSLGAAQPTTATNNFGYLLPSLDLNLLVRPDLKTRFDFSRTETPTSNGRIVPNTTYGGRVGALSATGNNPALLPYLSNNFDLGAEWYYSRNDYVSVDLFYKAVTQFPTASVRNITVPGVIDTAPGTTAIPDPNFGNPAVFAESTYTNAGKADVHGVELTLQQMLWGGFGFQINGTYAASNANFDNNATISNQFALPGVGNSANFIGFYQNYGFQARLAVQWQGSQLLALGQQQGGGAFGAEPVYLASSTNVDFSAQYDINRYVNVFFEANNLTDAIYHTYGRFTNQTLDLVDYGRSYQFGVRAKFD